MNWFLAHLYLILGSPEWMWARLPTTIVNLVYRYRVDNEPGYYDVMVKDRDES